MKDKIVRVALSVAAVLLWMSATPRAWAARCSLEGTTGTYGFTLNGVVILPTGPVPISAVGRAALAPDGSVSGTEARSVGGGFAEETFTGTYTVNSDCTGSATLRFYEAAQLVRTSILSVVFDNNQRDIRMVQKSLELPNGSFLPVVISVDAKKIFTEED